MKQIGNQERDVNPLRNLFQSHKEKERKNQRRIIL